VTDSDYPLDLSRRYILELVDARGAIQMEDIIQGLMGIALSAGSPFLPPEPIQVTQAAFDSLVEDGTLAKRTVAGGKIVYQRPGSSN
jgi:hypothetical protein